MTGPPNSFVATSNLASLASSAGWLLPVSLIKKSSSCLARSHSLTSSFYELNSDYITRQLPAASTKPNGPLKLVLLVFLPLLPPLQVE